MKRIGWLYASMLCVFSVSVQAQSPLQGKKSATPLEQSFEKVKHGDFITGRDKAFYYYHGEYNSVAVMNRGGFGAAKKLGIVQRELNYYFDSFERDSTDDGKWTFLIPASDDVLIGSGDTRQVMLCLEFADGYVSKFSGTVVRCFRIPNEPLKPPLKKLVKVLILPDSEHGGLWADQVWRKNGLLVPHEALKNLCGSDSVRVKITYQ